MLIGAPSCPHPVATLVREGEEHITAYDSKSLYRTAGQGFRVGVKPQWGKGAKPQRRLTWAFVGGDVREGTVL